MSAYTSRWRPWSEQDKATARQMKAAGKTSAQIGAKLGRTAVAVRAWLHLQYMASGEPPPPRVAAAKSGHAARVERVQATTSRRQCLRCQRGFQSWGAGNRMCDPCRGAASAYA